MRRPVFALALALALGAAGCGLPADDEAHVVSQVDLPTAPPTQPMPPTRPTGARPSTETHVSVPARVYFARDARVVPVPTIVRAATADPVTVGNDLLDQLKLGPTAALGKGMTSRLTGERKLALLAVIDSVGVIELGPPSEAAGEARDGLWTAQLVMTLCSLEKIRAVRFTSNDGRTFQVLLPNGKLVTGDVAPDQVAALVEPGGETPAVTHASVQVLTSPTDPAATAPAPPSPSGVVTGTLTQPAREESSAPPTT